MPPERKTRTSQQTRARPRAAPRPEHTEDALPDHQDDRVITASNASARPSSGPKPPPAGHCLLASTARAPQALVSAVHLDSAHGPRPSRRAGSQYSGASVRQQHTCHGIVMMPLPPPRHRTRITIAACPTWRRARSAPSTRRSAAFEPELNQRLPSHLASPTRRQRTDCPTR